MTVKVEVYLKQMASKQNLETESAQLWRIMAQVNFYQK